MLRRFDVIQDETGKWRFKGLHPGLELKNWALGIEPEKNQILVGCTSKAMKVINRCKSYPLKEGSLLLYTKPNVFFSIWHDKDFQDILDRYNIVSMRPIKTEVFSITITKLNGKIVNPVLSMKNVRLLSKKKIIGGTTKKDFKSEIFIITCELLNEKSYLIQKAFKLNMKAQNDDERILYIHKGISYKELPSLIEDDYLDFSRVFNELAEE